MALHGMQNAGARP
jgi:hypothetical protein